MIIANYAMNLDGPSNVRELGGYPTKSGKHTRKGQFLRSDNPFKLSDYDCETLYRYGVRLQVDLRSDFECEKEPSKLIGYKDIEFKNYQMVDNMNSNMGAMKIPDDMAETYIDLIDNAQAKYADMFRLILKYPDECVLFNCTGGKDRTGTTAALLLKIAGCPDDVIIADYAATYENLKRDTEQSVKLFEERGMKIAPHLMRSDPDTMERTLAHFNKTYGDIDNWMTRAGLTPSEIAGMKKKLLG